MCEHGAIRGIRGQILYLKQNKIHQIYSQMQLNQQNTKMQTQTQAMMNAIRFGLISTESALKYSVNLQELKAQLGMGV